MRPSLRSSHAKLRIVRFDRRCSGAADRGLTGWNIHGSTPFSIENGERASFTRLARVGTAGGSAAAPENAGINRAGRISLIQGPCRDQALSLVSLSLCTRASAYLGPVLTMPIIGRWDSKEGGGIVWLFLRF
jgi:hypothetical protein